MTGRKIAHYEFLREIGRGGMGVVYQARDTHLDRLVAIKLLAAEAAANPERRRRFVQEARAASALNHPNIVTIHDISNDGEADYIVMEYVAGSTIDKLIPRKGMRLNDALNYASQIASALAAAHAAGIVHRDLKPSNVVIGEDGRARVLDFGLAKLTDPADSEVDATETVAKASNPETQEGTILGTVAYMSPEQAEGRKVDARSDIFSFGTLLYEMCSGRRPFHGDSTMSTLGAIIHKEPEPLDAEVPYDLKKVILRCLKKDPAKRFQHMGDVRIALEELKEESDSGSLRSSVSAIAPRSRFPWARVTVGCGLLVAAAALIWVWYPRPAPPPSVPVLALRQITQDRGLTYEPAISPDGNLIAYSSNRVADGGMDIWVQQLTAGAQPVRVTRHPARDDRPSFSPDGGQIVFVSARDGGGLYIVPALGGEERLLLAGLYTAPRFSPDGRFVLAIPSLTPSNDTVIIPVAGGRPRRLVEGFPLFNAAIWSPDGQRVLLQGSRDLSKPQTWWIVGRDGGEAIELGNPAGEGSAPLPTEWVGDSVLYARGNLWRIRLSSATGKLEGPPEKLTSGTASERAPRAVSVGGRLRIAFSSVDQVTNLQSLPIDPASGKPAGEPTWVHSDRIYRDSPSASADGRLLAFRTVASRASNLMVRDMVSGVERTVLPNATGYRFRLSPDGSTIAFNPQYTETTTEIQLLPVGGAPRTLCKDCGLVFEWTADGKRIVFRSGRPMRFSSIDVATGERKVIAEDPKRDLHAAAASPNGKWFAIHYAPAENVLPIFLAPVRNGAAGPRDQWIPIVDRPGTHVRPWWSHDGRILYFLSNAEGQVDIWMQRFDPATGRLIGAPAVAHRAAPDVVLQPHPLFGPAVFNDRLIFRVFETKGNVWLAEEETR